MAGGFNAVRHCRMAPSAVASISRLMPCSASWCRVACCSVAMASASVVDVYILRIPERAQNNIVILVLLQCLGHFADFAGACHDDASPP